MKKIPENVRTTLMMLFIGVVLLCVFYLPKKIESNQLERFGKPLFEHEIPAGAYRVQNSAVRDQQGGSTAAVLLGTELSPEEVLEFYSDVEYLPARSGEQVKISAKSLDEASLNALKSAGKYREGDSYCFVYLYSIR